MSDLGAFCARVARFDPATLVRLSGGAVWARLPFDVLVTRPIAGPAPAGPAEAGPTQAGPAPTEPAEADPAPAGPGPTKGATDVTYRVDELLADLSGTPPLRDTEWRGALPLAAGRTLEEIPAAELRGIAEAAAATLRAAPPTLGERRVRDALLDHVAITVTADDGESAEIPLRLVLGLTRMGFLGETPVAVRRSGGWTGLVGEFGAAWYRPALSFLTI
ncbi:hypothetical protein AB0M43_24535 [Longispora sp. NPDC051575]|uniref:hypothetical protein n=1 Tax=Longispora sp. NPDC051575 TaxID=3154943 RepID=UPI00341E23E8